MKATDLTNQQFGDLIVIKRGENIGRFAGWICECQCCGSQLHIRSDLLKSGKATGCGKNKKTKFKIDYAGKQFENYTVIKRLNNNWECLTDDGNIIYKTSTELARAKKYYNDSKKQKEKKNENIQFIKKLHKHIKHMSEGEFIIMSLLLQNNLMFEMEKTFSDLKSEKNGFYRFDFFVNNNYIIEYDGEQHFKEIDFFNNLKEQISSDNIKNQYCKNNNIPIIRIPYTHLSKLSIKDLIPETSQFIINN